MRMCGLGRLVFGLAMALSAVAVPVFAQAPTPFIAGTAPSVRPNGAPTITEFRPDAAWTTRALSGVSEPYPASLGFLRDQGPWFTPFIHPGFSDQYDLRAWHRLHGDAAISAQK